MQSLLLLKFDFWVVPTIQYVTLWYDTFDDTTHSMIVTSVYMSVHWTLFCILSIQESDSQVKHMTHIPSRTYNIIQSGP